MSFCLRPNVCKKCGKPLTLFEGWTCLECEKAEQQQKPGKWDRLYSWLNDMRLGIAPDETVTDIDERHCRESQTDLLDEIMEWMIKAESEDKE